MGYLPRAHVKVDDSCWEGRGKRGAQSKRNVLNSQDNCQVGALQSSTRGKGVFKKKDS